MSNMPCSRTPARQSSADHLALLYRDFRRVKGVVPHIETFEAQSLQQSCLRPVGSMTLCLTFGITPASPRLSFRWLACLAGAESLPQEYATWPGRTDPILVLCYNITLAAWLRSMVAAKSIDHLVHVYHFHDWCGKQLKTYHIPKPKWGDDYADKLIDTVITAVENDRIPKNQYGAVIIDEAQDFEENWLKLVVQMVDPKTNSLLLLYDDAQSIYKKGTLNFPLSRVGVHARGRTTIFKKNYRNTNEIVDFAYHFVDFYLNFQPLDKEGELGDKIPLIQPHAIERHGPIPQLKQLNSFEGEAKHIVADFKMRHEAGSDWKDMCVVFRDKWMGDLLETEFHIHNLPVQWIKEKSEKENYNPVHQKVTLMVIYNIKGLEYPIVAIAGVGSMPRNQSNRVNEAKLLYVAMTRSTDTLLVTYNKPTEFSDRMVSHIPTTEREAEACPA